MRYSQMLIPTLKEDPADAQIISHKLMLRAGMIRKVAAGIYNYLPLGLRVIHKISNIIREEMNQIGCQEILMPMVQPQELWQKSGRLNDFGPMIAKFKDARGAPFCLGPTHEEVVTDLIQAEVASYRELPLSVYQIQTKFRDEIRPRFGLMRGREFLMKDAYSFCLDQGSALRAYDDMYGAYRRIFERCGLDFRVVEADTGAIGGKRSHEFQVIADNGEDLIASCDACGYAANVELAVIKDTSVLTPAQSMPAIEKVATPATTSIEAVADLLAVPTKQVIKSVLLMLDDLPVLALYRGDHDMNEAKLKRAFGKRNARMMSDTELSALGLFAGYVGPVGAPLGLSVIADHALKGATEMICGANEVGSHLVHVAEGRDFTCQFADIRLAQEGDICGNCGAAFRFYRGIEVGHVFYLGTRYSEVFGAKVLGDDGKEHPMEMGCYGIGVGRTAAACIEQHHDESGIKWPASIAPFSAALVRLSHEPELVAAADELYAALGAKGIDVLYDDRDERPGVKFKDHDLIGCPIRITVGGRSFKEGLVEVTRRDTKEMTRLGLSEVVPAVMSLLKVS